MGNQEVGASSGSRASTEPQERLGPSGFDPARAAFQLWALLDDIDTLDDACRADDAAFRSAAQRVQRRRFEIMSGKQWDQLAAKGYSRG